MIPPRRVAFSPKDSILPVHTINNCQGLSFYRHVCTVHSTSSNAIYEELSLIQRDNIEQCHSCVRTTATCNAYVSACVRVGAKQIADFNGNKNSLQLATKSVLFPVSFNETSTTSNAIRRRMIVCKSMNMKGRLK
jgi:hypothetical protein